MALFTDATLRDALAVLQTRNARIQALIDATEPSTWKKIQNDVKTGHASDYPIGTRLTDKYVYNNTEYDFPWIVVDNNRPVTWEDGSVHPSLILLAEYASIQSVPFDAPEDTVVDAEETTALDGWYYWGKTNEGNVYTALNLSVGDSIPHSSYDSIHRCAINSLDILRYGYNRYKDSAMRQFINSSMPKNYWWESKHTGDIAPSQAASYDGFLLGFGNDFLSVINPVKVQVATNTVTDGGVTDVMYDRFWLPSVEELYGSPQVADVEGAYWPYIKTITGLDSPSNNANDGRITYALENHSSAQAVRGRSAYRGNAYYTWICTYTGQIYYTYSYNAYRARVACAIS